MSCTVSRFHYKYNSRPPCNSDCLQRKLFKQVDSGLM